MATGTINQGLTLKKIAITGTVGSDLYFEVDDKLPQGSVAVAVLTGSGYLCAASTQTEHQYIKCTSTGTKTFTVAYI